MNENFPKEMDFGMIRPVTAISLIPLLTTDCNQSMKPKTLEE